MIAVTGATGRLGKAILQINPEAQPIYRSVPNTHFDVIIHAATMRGMTAQHAEEFHTFNIELARYAERHNPTIVNVGSCWQILEGKCQQQAYTLMKNQQQSLFSQAIHVIPYWIFGPERGFIFDLKQHIHGTKTLTFTGSELRDFIYVDDVARTCLNAITMQPGRYCAASKTVINPNALAREYGIDFPIREDDITAELAYPLPVISSISTTVADYLNGSGRSSQRNRT
jgi:hypothetical protein